MRSETTRLNPGWSEGLLDRARPAKTLRSIREQSRVAAIRARRPRIAVSRPSHPPVEAGISPVTPGRPFSATLPRRGSRATARPRSGCRRVPVREADLTGPAGSGDAPAAVADRRDEPLSSAGPESGAMGLARRAPDPSRFEPGEPEDDRHFQLRITTMVPRSDPDLMRDDPARKCGRTLNDAYPEHPGRTISPFSPPSAEP
jgi:hypothetical protein